MKKETIFAVVLGILFGVGIAVFLVLTAKEKAITEKKVISPQLTPTISVALNKEQSLEITDPKPNFITAKNTVTIKGKAPKDSLLIFQSPTTEKALKTQSENFSISFPLSVGENIIRITAYEDKLSDDKTLKVYYLDE